jgi:hypothetical protein
MKPALMKLKSSPSIDSTLNSDIPARRAGITESIEGDGFSFAVTVGFHPIYGSPLEVFLTQRGKSGTPLEGALYDLGVAASKIMQEYDTSETKILDLQHQLSIAENKLLHYRQIVGETD